MQSKLLAIPQVNPCCPDALSVSNQQHQSTKAKEQYNALALKLRKEKQPPNCCRQAVTATVKSHQKKTEMLNMTKHH